MTSHKTTHALRRAKEFSQSRDGTERDRMPAKLPKRASAVLKKHVPRISLVRENGDERGKGACPRPWSFNWELDHSPPENFREIIFYL